MSSSPPTESHVSPPWGAVPWLLIVQYGLAILTVFLLAWAWEFWLEERISLSPFVSQSHESTFERWEYVVTVVGFSAIALIVPTAIGIVLDRKRRRAERDIERLNRELETRIERKVDELRRANEALLRSEKLAVVGKISAGIGHDLRGPIGAIGNAAYYLATVTASDGDEKFHRHVEIIRQQTARAADILSALRDSVKGGVGEVEETDIHSLIRASLENVTIPRSVRIETQFDNTVPSLPLDPRQIGRVVTNLLANAIQAMPQGGSLTITTRNDEDAVAVDVQDTGIGIQDDDLPRIFEPLFSTRKDGIGLGLSIVRDIVENHGGSLSVESQPGKGSTFHLLFLKRGVCTFGAQILQ